MEDFRKNPSEGEQALPLTGLLRAKIRSEDGLRRVMYLLREVQEAVRESGLDQDVVIMGESVIGVQEKLVDVYLDVYDVHERDRRTHNYPYLDQYRDFLRIFQEKLRELRVSKNHLPSTQVHNLFDEGNVAQPFKFRHGYELRINKEGVTVETRDHSYSLEATTLPPESVNWQNLNQLVGS